MFRVIVPTSRHIVEAGHIAYNPISKLYNDLFTVICVDRGISIYNIIWLVDIVHLVDDLAAVNIYFI